MSAVRAEPTWPVTSVRNPTAMMTGLFVSDNERFLHSNGIRTTCCKHDDFISVTSSLLINHPFVPGMCNGLHKIQAAQQELLADTSD